jgi:stearoyl-CoA desaturase (Delta-9 desaturase)
MILLLLILFHWYASLFFQSFFHHRYAAHGLFVMSKGWERFFYVCCFITQGSSYISANSYGIMHRLHHAHTDDADDPHSPLNSPGFLATMWQTRNSYHDIYRGKTPVDDKYRANLPEWKAFDKIAHNWVTRLVWIAIYISLYIYFATAWWMYLFLPFTIAIGSVQGAAVNWWAHKFGYENYKLDNTSKNILPFDVLFWGEAYHNNHHKNPSRPNNAVKWFEFDAAYLVMLVMHKLHIIRIKKLQPQHAVVAATTDGVALNRL